MIRGSGGGVRFMAGLAAANTRPCFHDACQPGTLRSSGPGQLWESRPHLGHDVANRDRTVDRLVALQAPAMMQADDPQRAPVEYRRSRASAERVALMLEIRLIRRHARHFR